MLTSEIRKELRWVLTERRWMSPWRYIVQIRRLKHLFDLM